MSSRYSSIFDSIKSYVSGSPLAGWVLILAILTLIIGINGFIEDTYSSYTGVQMIETTFGVRPASWEFTYWAMSLFFQVVTVLAFFTYLSDRDKNWIALWISMSAQAVDFIADVWYRSNGTFSMVNTVVSTVMTFVFFTIGSEVALTFGFGLTSKLFVEGSLQLSITLRNVFVGMKKFFKMIASGRIDDEGATDSNISGFVKDRSFSPPPQPVAPQNRPSPSAQMTQKPPTDSKPPQGGGDKDRGFRPSK